MSLFIGLLAFAAPAIQDEVKVGVLEGSLLSALCGAALLSIVKRGPPKRAQPPPQTEPLAVEADATEQGAGQ